MENIVIVGAARTPIGDFMGLLKDVSAVDLGKIAVIGAMEKAKITANLVEDFAAGMVYKAGLKGNPARQIQLRVGIPAEVVAVTVEQQCASSMRALEIICQQIMTGKIDTGVVCGLESMSRVPYYLLNARKGLRMGDGIINDGLTYDALIDAFHNYHMGITAENLAETYHISREEQDYWAYLSHQRAYSAQIKGLFEEEIVQVEIQEKNGICVVKNDEHPNGKITLEMLSKMKPAFKKDGTVTAGNASSINDGASSLVVMSEKKADHLGIKPLARILSTATYGVKPEIMGIGPVYAIPLALRYAQKESTDVDYYEINEAFAAQFLAVKKVLNIDEDKINANGSGISLGHPVGCTGLRLIISLLYELKRRAGTIGVASLCAGGGPAMAAVIENIQ